MHAFRHEGSDVADRRLLDRADIGHDGAGCQTSLHGLGHGRVGADRSCQDHQIAIGDSRRRILEHLVAESELQRLGARFGGPRAADHALRQAEPSHRQRHGGTDQPDTDQRHLAKGLPRGSGGHCG